MKLNEKKFTITLTEDEVRDISEALNKVYKSLGEVTSAKVCDERIKYRHLRNDFGSLINMFYMGEDA